jgi:hypothetical protein
MYAPINIDLLAIEGLDAHLGAVKAPEHKSISVSEVQVSK